MRVVDTDTEPDSAHSTRLADLVPYLLHHDSGARRVPGVEIRQGSFVVAAPAPGNLGEIGVVADPEVVKRAQQSLIDGIPDPELGGSSAAEEQADVRAVATLGGGGQPY